MGKALDELLAGHSRALATGKSRPQAGERLPTAAVLACTDERVVPQMVFDHPPGKIYMVRMAGNVYTPEVAGSLELAVVRLGCPLIVVLGHTDCTAVELARSNPRLDGRAYEITRRIRAALEGLPPASTLAQAVEGNVRHVLNELRERDTVFRAREKSGTLEMVGAVYELETGRVRLL